MKILCIGEALIDMICTDKGTPLHKGTHFIAKPGGAPANTAAVIATLGGNAEMAAMVGDDAFGQKLIDTMQEFGVGTKWMIKSPQHFTTLAFVSLMENGERDFVFNRGADGRLSIEIIDTIKPGEFSIIHFGSATAFLPGDLQLAYHGLLQKAIGENVFISFDPNYRHLLYKDRKDEFIKLCREFLPVSHFIKMSDEEAMLITCTNTVTEAAESLQKITKTVFAITTGKDGALLRTGNFITTVPGFPVEAVDTTGAGDAFTGAVLYQLSKMDRHTIDSLSKDEWKVIITNANKTGAVTCKHYGALEAFRQLEKNLF